MPKKRMVSDLSEGVQSRFMNRGGGEEEISRSESKMEEARYLQAMSSSVEQW
jgi:hypothetical protein